MPILIRLHWTQGGRTSREALTQYYGMTQAETGPFLAALDDVIARWGTLFLHPPFMQQADGNAAVNYTYQGAQKYRNVNWAAERGQTVPGKVQYVNVIGVWDAAWVGVGDETHPTPSPPAT